MRLLLILALSSFALVPLRAGAQDAQTLADIRQDLSVLYVEIQKLKRELSTTGASSVNTGGGSVLDRVNAIEGELQRLTGKTEELEFRINRVVEDGTNRVGDLEFRLVELEGGDVTQLGETTTLGGGEEGGTVPAAPIQPAEGAQTEMAVGEQADYQRASDALSSGDFRGAADMFQAFVTAYPGSPLEAEAQVRRGQALAGIGDEKAAARIYLDVFSANPNGSMAPEALYRLGASLSALGQVDAACQTLSQVEIRFPGNQYIPDAQSAMTAAGCP